MEQRHALPWRFLLNIDHNRIRRLPVHRHNTFDCPLPRKLSGSRTFTWSNPVKFGVGPAYRAGTATPVPMVTMTFDSALRPRIPCHTA